MTLPAAMLPEYHTFCADVLGMDLRTRAGHVTIAKAFDGLELDATELDLFRQCTGLEQPRAGRSPYLLELVGRQSGKTEQAGARLTYEGVAAVLAGERDVCCVGISQDHRAAQGVLFGYVRRFFESPLLASMVVSITSDTITLKGNVRVMVLPCRPAAIRGLRCRIVVLDEIAHYRSSENLPLDRATWSAALPTLLTTGGRLLALSSPHASSGLAFDLHRKHFAQPGEVLVWQSSSLVLNPCLTETALSQIREVDPEGAAAEIDGQFLQNVSALHDEETLAAAVDEGVRVRPPQSGVTYLAHLDISTGTKAGGDPWACAVAHRDGNVSVLDALLVIKPPFSPETACQQSAAMCRPYDITRFTGDRFAAGLIHEAVARVGMQLDEPDRTTSDYHIALAGLVNSGLVRLLDHSGLLRELRGLERRRGATRDLAIHMRGRHDDAAAVVAGACVRASISNKPMFAAIMPVQSSRGSLRSIFQHSGSQAMRQLVEQKAEATRLAEAERLQRERDQATDRFFPIV